MKKGKLLYRLLFKQIHKNDFLILSDIQNVLYPLNPQISTCTWCRHTCRGRRSSPGCGNAQIPPQAAEQTSSPPTQIPPCHPGPHSTPPSAVQPRNKRFMCERWRLKGVLVFSVYPGQEWPCLFFFYLCEGHGWLSGKEQSCEVGFHLVFPLCVLLHLREITDKHLLRCEPDTSSCILKAHALTKHVNISCSVHPENPIFNFGNNVWFYE